MQGAVCRIISFDHWRYTVKLLSRFGVVFAILGVGITMFSFAFAQTPDGQTAVEETACAPLKEDGVTTGLYGLCIAYCEAQVYISPDPLISETLLEEQEDAGLSDRSFASYNKKKRPSDPNMPCIQIHVIREPVESLPNPADKRLAGMC